MGADLWLVIMFAIAGIALHLSGIRYLRDSSIVDCTLADVVEVSSPRQESPMAVENWSLFDVAADYRPNPFLNPR